MTGLDRDTSKSPDRTGVCCTGRCAPSQCETITGPSFSSLNKPDQERTPAYRDSSGSESPSGCLLCYFFRRLGGAIWGIPGKTIGEVSEIATTIAPAVEEQSTATEEISRNVQQAAAGTQEVSGNIAGVTQAASATGQSAQQVLESAGDLSKQSEALRSEVEKFLVEVRAQ